jgi:hypothetical protein
MAGKAGQMGEQARQMGEQAKDEAQGMRQRLKKLLQYRPGPMGWVALLVVSLALIVSLGIVLLLLSPLLLFFSPVLIPAGIFLSVCTAAIVGIGGSVVVALSALLWLYRYLKGQQPRGSRNADHLLGRAHDTAQHLKHQANDVLTHIPMPTLA